MWIKQILTQFVVVRINQIFISTVNYKIKCYKKNLIYGKLRRCFRIIRLKYSYNPHYWIKKKQRNNIRQFFTLNGHMRIRRARLDSFPILEKFIVHECCNLTLIEKMLTFYHLMIKIQKRMKAKPVIRKARIEVLNVLWNNILGNLAVTTKKF